MSEVASGCGSWILLRMYNGDAPKSDATNQWPIQPRPPKDMEELSGVHGDVTNNAGPTTAPGEMERGITQDSVEIS
jgi:hypothetical protein